MLWFVSYPKKTDWDVSFPYANSGQTITSTRQAILKRMKFSAQNTRDLWVSSIMNGWSRRAPRFKLLADIQVFEKCPGLAKDIGNILVQSKKGGRRDRFTSILKTLLLATQLPCKSIDYKLTTIDCRRVDLDMEYVTFRNNSSINLVAKMLRHAWRSKWSEAVFAIFDMGYCEYEAS